MQFCLNGFEITLINSFQNIMLLIAYCSNCVMVKIFHLRFSKLFLKRPFPKSKLKLHSNVCVYIAYDFEYCFMDCLLLFCSIFILLSQESEGCAIFWTNPHSLKSCGFEFFGWFFDFFPVNLLLVRSCQAEINVNCLIQMSQQRDKGESLNLDHAIIITWSP